MQPGSTSFENVVGVVEGTTVELYSESKSEDRWYGSVNVDGIDHDDYKPNMVGVK